jgi:ribose-phosphate pyrophosphokinase
VLSGKAIDNINNSTLDELVVCDTIPLSEAASGCEKIRQLSVAGLLGESISRISSGQSLSSMFVD